MLNTETNCPGSAKGGPSDTLEAVRQRLINQLLDKVRIYFGGSPPSTVIEVLNPAIHHVLFMAEEGDFEDTYKKELTFQSIVLYELLTNLYELSTYIKGEPI